MNPSNADIRQFILDTFNDEDFEVFCADNFPNAQAEFSSSMSLLIKALRLVEYCQHRGDLGSLLATLQKARPEAYVQRFPQGASQPQGVSKGDETTRDTSPRLLSQNRRIPAWGWAVAVLGLTTLLAVSVVVTQLFAAKTNTPLPATSSGPTAIAVVTSTSSPGPEVAATSAPSPAETPAPTDLSEPTQIPAQADTPNELILTLAKDVTMTLVQVPAGDFLMGSDPAKDKDAQPDEQPRHRVYVSAFYIGKYEVTNEQFAAFVQATHYQTTAEREGTGGVWDGNKWNLVKGVDWHHPRGPGSDVSAKQHHPVVDMSWDDAVAFGEWLSQVVKRDVRLPTEAEWEKAACGTDGRLYSWGDAWDAGKANTWDVDNSGPHDTTPVGTYSPAGDSPYGAADMAGNVSEWVSDGYNQDEYKEQVKSSSPIKDPRSPPSRDLQVLRGGSWRYDQFSARCAFRNGVAPVNRYDYISFRVVVPLAPGS